jgi:ATPases of the AAA+ class
MCKNIFLDYVLAGYPLLWVSTYEEFRAISTFAQELSTNSKNNYSFFSWDRATGLKAHAFDKGILKSTTPKDVEGLDDPIAILGWAGASLPEHSVLFLKDYHHYCKKDIISRQIRNLIQTFKAQSKVLVILSHTVDIPAEIEKEITVINFKLPDAEQLKIVLKSVCEAASSPGHEISYPKDDEAILKASLGMTSFEAENAFSLSMIEKKKFDVSVITREKAAIVKKTGLLEVLEPDVTLDDVGGLENLKDWLEARKDCFSEKARKFKITPPKGILLIGTPGTGKSLIAKAVASAWKRPMLRLDMGKVFGSLVGESESNLRKCLHLSEAISPCVLFVDELEKAFAGAKSGANDSGVTRRLFGSFLTWLQEKTADVFLVATANNVQDLPPELLRGGRFDSIFWVDLPEEAQRQEILKIHLNKTERPLKLYNIPMLAQACKTFSGAEIEVWVKEALVYAFQHDHELQDNDLIATVNSITPIAKLMATAIDEAKTWAKEHGVKYASRETIKTQDQGDNKRKIQCNLN